MRRLILLLAACAAGLSPIDRPDHPPYARPAHWCASACVCGCEKGDPCRCDGRTCPAVVMVPGSGFARLQLEAEKLPSRTTACPDRDPALGLTFHRHTSGWWWVCNDPDCIVDQGDNWEFSAPPCPSCPKEH